MNPGNRKLLPIEWNSEALPTLPAIAHRLIGMAGNDEANAAELAEIIGQDPSLTLKVLQAANSAFFALRMEVTSIRHALVLLGMQEVKRIALGSILTERFLCVDPEAKPQARALWRHVLAVAVLAQDLSETGEEEPDFYTLGLLHDLGWLVLISQAPKVFASLATEKSRVREEAEEYWGVDHQLWGAQMAERWSMPEPFQIVNLHHHDPFAETSPPGYLLAVHLANHLADIAGFKVLNTPVEDVDERALQGLGLDSESLEEMEQAVLTERERIETLWRIMVG